MKNKKIWVILLVVGIFPFIFPLLNFIYELTTSSTWTLFDWLICYSFVYWPTYVVGFILLFVAIYKLKQ